MDPLPHDREQEPVHWTVQVAPSAQFTLPLGPTVTSQSAPAAQLMLHEFPQVPVQVAFIPQLTKRAAPAAASRAPDVTGSPRLARTRCAGTLRRRWIVVARGDRQEHQQGGGHDVAEARHW